ncbi:MAG: nicotinate phosphoribosyltransferase [Bacteroidales bacterium]|nr:nicotinate phosphoribosyltransferase [Bacteroidales bacterium]
MIDILKRHSGLYTDHYQLTMAQGYLLSNRHEVRANFDYFFRKNPFNGAYVVFAGLSDLIDLLENLHFSEDDCHYLESIGFNPKFTEYLRGFRFNGNLFAPAEGEVVFPYEPIIRIEGNILESQIIETALLNIINFESLIATKAHRIRMIAGNRVLVDFGMRRAQGLGSIHASKAAIIGGFNSTSNVYSAFMFGLRSTGTQAHSWVQSFDDELSAFRAFAQAFPNQCILLVDTYDTLKTGIPNAITVAKEMEAAGHRLLGIRLDSGDLAYLSKRARKMFDDAGLHYVKIACSNQLDEYVIRSLLNQGAPIDFFGVGTRLATGLDDAVLDGVYKLSASDGKPRLKISENIEKMIIPSIKKVFRFIDEDGKLYADGIVLEHETSIDTIFHPFQTDKSSDVSKLQFRPLLQQMMNQGKRTMALPTATEAATYTKVSTAQLPDEHKRLEFPHIYKVGISRNLLDLRTSIVNDIRNKLRK